MALELSVVMPCLNEEETVGICVKKAVAAIQRLGIMGEVVVADNGSTDRSIAIAQSAGARVVYEKKKGYGNAYRAGIREAQGKYIIIGDSDNSYDFSDLDRFVQELRKGNEMVMGTRLKGKIMKGAMPWLHRFIGNPFLTWILNVFFQPGISDAHCGMRAFTKTAFERMKLRTTGMEFASEMVIRAIQVGLKITEIPITLYPDGRNRRPHLRSFRDGWRHLRFMLMQSPTYLYLIPGLSMFVFGVALMLILLPGPFFIAWHLVDIHAMVFASLMTLLGFQIVSLGVFAKIYSLTHDYILKSTWSEKLFKIFNLERGILLGGIIFMTGFVPNLYIFIKWILSHLGKLDDVRLALVASTLMIIGVQIVFASFYLSMVGMGSDD